MKLSFSILFTKYGAFLGGLRKRHNIGYIAIFSLIIFCGCVTKEAVKSNTEDVLRERITDYWNYKMKEEFDKSYAYEDPFFRKQVNLVNYIRRFRTDIVKWKSAAVKEIKLAGDSAEVDMILRTKVRLPQIKTVEHDSLTKEKWVKVDGVWYHVPEGFKNAKGSTN